MGDKKCIHDFGGEMWQKINVGEYIESGFSKNRTGMDWIYLAYDRD